ncbi:MAG: NADP-dependent phosphogluconate dehydrogenase [Thermoproteota archaeon]|jgi:6-phosphogluconate dehydrogenase|nr:NADP-dependent phosphogluconate dehydrogenase [Thermoproteota archaeon]
MSADLGLVGLGSMAENLVFQLYQKGLKTALYNRTPEKLKEFVLKNKDLDVIPCYDIDSFLNSIERPRKILLLIKAGQPVDEMINSLVSKLNEGDIIIDGGNSHFKDTERRYELLQSKGIRYLGAGISGGVEGARKGLSIMVGGDEKAYLLSSKIFDKISSHFDMKPSHSYFGKGGAGHFIKTIHNGIEYALIEDISEIYFLLRSMGKSNEEIADIFNDWNKGILASFLLNACQEVLRMKEDDNYLVDLILDKAEQKGTGIWASEISLEIGIPAPSISSAVYSRSISSLKERRIKLSSLLNLKIKNSIELEENSIKSALILANLIAYLQGFDILRNAGYYGYNFNLKEVIRVWLGGSIIRSELLKRLYEEKFGEDLFSSSLVLNTIEENILDFARVLSTMIRNGLPSLVLSSSFNYIIYLFSRNLPANLTQALRDYFGAHGFERIDKEGRFHLSTR